MWLESRALLFWGAIILRPGGAGAPARRSDPHDTSLLMKLLKFTACLLGLCALGMGAMAQTPETPEAAETPAQSPGNTADATQPDPLREAWLAEARALTNAQIIEEHGTAKGLDQIGVDVVVKGMVDGPISLVKGNLFVLGRVNGAVDIVGGSATILGTVTGPVNVLGGDLRVAGKIKRCGGCGRRQIAAGP